MKFAVIGAGLMGRAVVYDLARAEGVERVDVFDIDQKLAQKVAEDYGAGKSTGAGFDASEADSLAVSGSNPLSGYDAIISAVTYRFNPALTRLALAGGGHFFDLGGNNDVVASQFEMDAEARQAGVVVIPDCGLAPGMVSVLAAGGMREFDRVDSLRIRVGGLPQKPRPPLNYQMLFSAEGLINEYWEPVVILEDGKEKGVAPMSGLEELEFEGVGAMEAFYTSGGTSTLPQTYGGQVGFLDYKTIRYPGHCEMFRPMLELGLASREPLDVNGDLVEPRAVLKAVLDRELSFGEPDLSLVRLDFTGEVKGESKTLRYEIIDRADEESGLSSMMRMTAFPVAIIAWMAASGKIKARGVVPQEVAVDPDIFLEQLLRRNIKMTRSSF